MIGFPKHLNSRQDYENCHQMALAGLLERQQMIARWQALLDGSRHWVFKETVNEAYAPGENEKVLAETDSQGQPKFTCFELVDNPNAEIYKLAYTETTVNQRIAELEV